MIALALAGALALSAAAPPGDADPKALLAQMQQIFPGGHFQGRPGEWALYRISPAPFGYWRVAVVGSESTPHGQGTWLEVQMGMTPECGQLGMKLLTVGDPRQPLSIERALFRFMGGGLTELDPKTFKRAAAAPAEAGGAAQAPQPAPEPGVGGESYQVRQVPAGAYNAIRLDTHFGFVYWLSPQAPVFGLVEVERADGTKLELFDGGATGAKEQMGRAPEKAPAAGEGGKR